MSIRLLRSSTIAYILLALYANGEPSGPLKFMKYGFRWPTSYCTSLSRTTHTSRCQEPFKTHFIVHRSWPMYWDDDDDASKENDESVVPPYNLTNCSEIIPPSAADIKREFFNATLPINVMMKYWPNLYNHRDVYPNIVYWRALWNSDGKCSQNNEHPFLYFKNPINHLKKHNFLEILAAGGIKADDGEYDPVVIRAAIWNVVGVNPQIRCITDSNDNILLHEILLCFYKGPDLLKMSCRYDFLDCPEFDPEIGPNFKIKFPAARKAYS